MPYAEEDHTRALSHIVADLSKPERFALGQFDQHFADAFAKFQQDYPDESAKTNRFNARRACLLDYKSIIDRANVWIDDGYTFGELRSELLKRFNTHLIAEHVLGQHAAA